jgi:DNA recombination protein RmuC
MESMIEAVFLGIGLVVGFAIGALVMVVRHRSPSSGAAGALSAADIDALQQQNVDLTQQNGQLHEQIAQNNADIASLTAHATETAGQIDYFKKIIDQQRIDEQTRIAHAQAQESARAEEKRKADLAAHEEQSKVLQMLTPVQNSLTLLAQKVGAIEESRKEDSGTLAERLKTLGEQQQQLSTVTTSLSEMFSSNRDRGAWGEIELRKIIESAGLLEHVHFDVQVSVSGDNQSTANENTVRPDMVIHLPGKKSILIDSKVPFSYYEKACEIPDTASSVDLIEKKRLLADHAKALKKHIHDLRNKEYWKAFEPTPEFVIAFIPNEAILQAALEADPGLFEYAFDNKVALASPVTLWAVLKSVAYTWQQQDLTQDAKKLFDISKELYDRFAKLGSSAAALGTAIGRSVKAYNSFASTLESRVLVSARKMNKIDPTTIISDVPEISPEMADIRELTASELIENIESGDGGSGEVPELTL